MHINNLSGKNEFVHKESLDCKLTRLEIMTADISTIREMVRQKVRVALSQTEFQNLLEEILDELKELQSKIDHEIAQEKSS